ncbi:MAG: anaerobic ribonucleoside-triphosphate reductase activating protein [Thermodesulfobacteriota bacterium]
MVLPGIKGFLETSFVDWKGKLASVIFLGGCNFRCPYCHNHRLVLTSDSLEDIPWVTVKDRLRRLEGWVDGVCITGGEPTLHPSLPRILEELRSMGFHTKLDTNGSVPEVLERLIQGGLLDAVSMDIKAPLKADAYRRCSGGPIAVTVIERSIRTLAASGVQVEFRTTVVPGLLVEEDLVEIASLLPPGIPYLLQGFRPMEVLDPRLKEVVPYSEETLDRMRALVANVASKKGAAALVPGPVVSHPPSIRVRSSRQVIRGAVPSHGRARGHLVPSLDPW